MNVLVNTIFSFILGILPYEKDNISKNTIHLDHCYYKDCPPVISENSITDTVSSGIQHTTSE